MYGYALLIPEFGWIEKAVGMYLNMWPVLSNIFCMRLMSIWSTLSNKPSFQGFNVSLRTLVASLSSIVHMREVVCNYNSAEWRPVNIC